MHVWGFEGCVFRTAASLGKERQEKKNAIASLVFFVSSSLSFSNVVPTSTFSFLSFLFRIKKIIITGIGAKPSLHLPDVRLVRVRPELPGGGVLGRG